MKGKIVFITGASSGIGEDDIKASQKVCDDLGIKLRVRPFE